MRDRPAEKIRDMSRSVLPSKARKTARIMKAKVHRAERRRSKQMLDYLDDLDGDDFETDGMFYDNEDDLVDRAGVIKPEIRDVVRDRRDADKLGGFRRWAHANTKHLDSDVDKYFEVKKMLGTGVIKDHALGHFIRIESAQNPFAYRSILDYPERRNFFPCPWKTYDQLLCWIKEAIELDHARFNMMLREETGFYIKLSNEPCTSGTCWRVDDYVSQSEARHDESLCDSKDLLQCLASWRKTFVPPENDPYWMLRKPNKPCWVREFRRHHDAVYCEKNRRYITGVGEAETVANYFWYESHYFDSMNAAEATLAAFLKTKGIIE